LSAGDFQEFFLQCSCPQFKHTAKLRPATSTAAGMSKKIPSFLKSKWEKNGL